MRQVCTLNGIVQVWPLPIWLPLIQSLFSFLRDLQNAAGMGSLKLPHPFHEQLALDSHPDPATALKRMCSMWYVLWDEP